MRCGLVGANRTNLILWHDCNHRSCRYIVANFAVKYKEMDRGIKLDLNAPVKIPHLKGHDAAITGLKLLGNGKLNVCMVEFYKEGDPEPRHKELFFHLPDFLQAKNLPPRKQNFSISGYDFCEVKLITGSLLPGDEISLSYKVTKR